MELFCKSLSRVSFEQTNLSRTCGTKLIFFVSFLPRFDWDELNATNPFGDSLQEAVITLGWNKSTWENTIDEVPATECKSSMDLSPDELWAIGVLGYTEMKWDLYPLDPNCPEEELED